MVKFVSGWAGFAELFPLISQKNKFIVPFIDGGEEEILADLKQSGKLLCGWSTGAHIILKNIETLAEKYRQIILFAPFLKFTDYINPKILTLMIKKLKSEPQKVISDFYVNCGINYCSPSINDDTKEKLISGLEFLGQSKAEIPKTKINNVVVVHGINDKIVNFQSGQEVANLLNAKFIQLSCEHFFEERIISEIIYENTHKKIF